MGSGITRVFKETRIVLLLAPLLIVTVMSSGCRSSAAQRPLPTPTTHTVTTPPGRAGVLAVIGSFNRAVLIRAMTAARGYLTPSLAAQTPPMELASLLGLQHIPRGAGYGRVRVRGTRASAVVTYRTASGAVHDSLRLVRRGGTWLISAIRPL